MGCEHRSGPVEVPHVLTLPTLRNACVTLALGINGVRWGARPVPIEEERLPSIERGAMHWFVLLAREFGPALENRVKSILSAPPVMAALGAIGHPLVTIDASADREGEAQKLLEAVRSVDWSRGEHWAGIAGKMTAKGQLSVSGAKEVAYTVFAALTDPSQDAYHRVRRSAG